MVWNAWIQDLSLYVCPRGCLHPSSDDENLRPIPNGSDSYVKYLFSCHIGSVDKYNVIYCHGGGIKIWKFEKKSWESTGNYLICFQFNFYEKKIKNKKVRAILGNLKIFSPLSFRQLTGSQHVTNGLFRILLLNSGWSWKSRFLILFLSRLIARFSKHDFWNPGEILK